MPLAALAALTLAALLAALPPSLAFRAFRKEPTASVVNSILLVLFLIIKVVILLLVNRKGGYTTTVLS